MRFSHLVLGLVPLALATVHSAAAQQAGGAAAYTVTYFEAAAPDVAQGRRANPAIRRGQP